MHGVRLSTFVRFSDDCWLFVVVVVVVILFVSILVIIVMWVLRRHPYGKEKARADWPGGNVVRDMQGQHPGHPLSLAGTRCLVGGSSLPSNSLFRYCLAKRLHSFPGSAAALPPRPGVRHLAGKVRVLRSPAKLTLRARRPEPCVKRH